MNLTEFSVAARRLGRRLVRWWPSRVVATEDMFWRWGRRMGALR